MSLKQDKAKLKWQSEIAQAVDMKTENTNKLIPITIDSPKELPGNLQSLLTAIDVTMSASKLTLQHLRHPQHWCKVVDLIQLPILAVIQCLELSVQLAQNKETLNLIRFLWT